MNEVLNEDEVLALLRVAADQPVEDFVANLRFLLSLGDSELLELLPPNDPLRTIGILLADSYQAMRDKREASIAERILRSLPEDRLEPLCHWFAIALPWRGCDLSKSCEQIISEARELQTAGKISSRIQIPAQPSGTSTADTVLYSLSALRGCDKASIEAFLRETPGELLLRGLPCEDPEIFSRVGREPGSQPPQAQARDILRAKVLLSADFTRMMREETISVTDLDELCRWYGKKLGEVAASMGLK